MPLSATLPLLPVAAALGELAELEGGAVMEAALAAVPGFVRGEVGRLGPGDGLGRGERGEGWQRARLLSAVAELLGAVAGRGTLARSDADRTVRAWRPPGTPAPAQAELPGIAPSLP